MKLGSPLTRMFGVLIVFSVLIGTGCRSTLPVVISGTSSWNEERAVAVINRASNPSRLKYDLLVNGKNSKMDEWALTHLAANAHHDGFTYFTWSNHLDLVTQTNTTTYYADRIPYGSITNVSLEKVEGYGLGLCLCGLINPLLVEYVVHVRFLGEEMCYHEPGKKWGIFPLWLVRPFYFISEDRKTFAEELAQAFEYMSRGWRQKQRIRDKTAAALDKFVPDAQTRPELEASAAVEMERK